MKFNANDLELLKEKNIDPATVEAQLEMTAKGFPWLKIKSAATVGNGIFTVDDEMQRQSVEIWEKYLSDDPKIVKMVPASGAASRMFKDVFEFYNSGRKEPKTDFMKKFFAGIQDFAFFARLNFVALEKYGKSVLTLIDEGRYHDVADLLLNHIGLGYGHLPKALLQFHKTVGSTRAPLDEHLAEGAQYAATRNGDVNVHFTVSEEHLPLMEARLEEVKRILEKKYGKKFHVSFSIQKPSTDTVASLPGGEPYREEGKLFFRPGGHGALIENLNDLDADVVFIKNIDNVVPDALREPTILSKKILGGTLIAAKEKADRYLRMLDEGADRSRLMEMVEFCRTMLCISGLDAENMTDRQLSDWLHSRLNRPMRVCGMVKNEGEPGGGPFLVYDEGGIASPQILESVQLDPKHSAELMKNASHFNPVDLVCAVRNYKGEKFDLRQFVDPQTGFISSKSRKGVDILALELPGLWNGAMAGWNTIFVEVPAETFNPVKTVNDLLRSAHQPS